MTELVNASRHKLKAGTPWWRDERWRALAAQVVTVAVILAVLFFLINNMILNREAQGRPFSYEFMDNIAGFPVAMSLIPLDLDSTITRVMVAGILNTLLAGVVSILLSTVVGFLIGIMRLSANYLIAKLATAYIEIFRNIPLLVQLSFWYFGVLKLLPQQKDSLSLFQGAFLNVRGLYLPRPFAEPSFALVAAALVIGIVATIGMRFWAIRSQAATGRTFPVFSAGLALVIGLPVLVWLAVALLLGAPLSCEYPALQGFNFQGGFVILPEFSALILGLSMYTAAYIAEDFRAGLRSVRPSLIQAGLATGLTRWQVLRFVVAPQAIRIIIPSLFNQYVRLLKFTSVASIIGVTELTGAAMLVNARDFHPVTFLGAVAVTYLVIFYALSLLGRALYARFAVRA